MRDETKGTKTNRVMLNLAQYSTLEPPEPGIAAVVIDGVPIHGVHSIVIQAGVDVLTRCSIVFECEVSGTIAGKPVDKIVQEMKDRQN